MRRKSAFSWLTAFRKAFQNSKKKPEVDNEGYKKREKRRWSFHKSRELPPPPPPPPSPEKMNSEVPTAVVFLPREYYAAVIIQTVFRGYLARRALRALKGLVMLQALVRGSNVRRKTDMIVETMKALVRVQNKYSPSRIAAPFNGHRLSFSCTDNFWDSSSMKSREGSMFAGNWRNYHRRLDQIQANLKREEANSCALSYQNWRSDCNLYHKDEDPPETTWLDQWMASRTSISNRNRGRRLTTDHPFATPSPSIAAGSPRITPSTPNYMAATESAIARLRSRSVERERPPTARKRLSFPGPEGIGGNRVWSPRCRGMGRQMSNASSSVAESFGGEVSPASTADIRRWLR